MSRALIETLLKTDPALAGIGLLPQFILNQHDVVERPRDDGLFAVIRWEESTIFSQNYTGMNNGIARAPRMLSLWIHSPMEWSTDFELIDQVLDRVDVMFDEIEDMPGSDGYSITNIGNSSRSGDLKDEGFMTVTRNAAYRVLYRRT